MARPQALSSTSLVKSTDRRLCAESDPGRTALAAPVSLTIGGRPATIQYAGGAPYQVMGMFQVNAKVPDGIGSGPQPVVVTVAVQ